MDHHDSRYRSDSAPSHTQSAPTLLIPHRRWSTCFGRRDANHTGRWWVLSLANTCVALKSSHNEPWSSYRRHQSSYPGIIL